MYGQQPREAEGKDGSQRDEQRAKRQQPAKGDAKDCPHDGDERELKGAASAGQPIAAQEVVKNVGIEFNPAHIRKAAGTDKAIERCGKQIRSQGATRDPRSATDNYDFISEKPPLLPP